MQIKRLDLAPPPGIAPAIGLYLSAMEEVREQLRETVRGMTNEQVARRAVAGAHPIGALVLHIGEAEWWWIQCNIRGRELSSEDRRTAHWDVLEDAEVLDGRDYSARYCLEAIDHIRTRTRAALASLTDADLDRTFDVKMRSGPANASLRW
ncbi:MAG: DUF664 domain-containing protein, partial [Acidobacteria bacterium]|nr:DUF664 domain-containing protein [Acidobacteriota bacterium]